MPLKLCFYSLIRLERYLEMRERVKERVNTLQVDTYIKRHLSISRFREVLKEI